MQVLELDIREFVLEVDATRVNITINGIPFNDAESHGVFWVNMPDLSSSTRDIQIQRGVGSSSYRCIICFCNRKFKHARQC